MTNLLFSHHSLQSDRKAVPVQVALEERPCPE